MSKVDVGGGGVVVAPPSASSSSAAAGIGGSLADDETEIARLEELATRHENAMAHTDRALDWLNRPTYAHLERRQQEIGRRLERHFISVQLPELEYQVLFHEKLPPTLPVRLPPPSSSSSSSSAAAAEKASAAASAANEKSGVGAAGLHDAPIVLLSDAEQHRDNPAVHKHHKLARSLLSAGFAKELKPDSEERRRLDSLVALPPTTRLREEDRYSVSQPHITRHASPHHINPSPHPSPPPPPATHTHRELMWKFRYSLTKEKRALTKLLKCVDWADTREVQQAQSLVEQWALVDVQVCCVFACCLPAACCLLLLTCFRSVCTRAGPSRALRQRLCWRGRMGEREFAVAALRDRSDDTQLLSYLLPLVQAIQYERVLQQSPAECPLAALLISRPLANVGARQLLALVPPGRALRLEATTRRTLRARTRYLPPAATRRRAKPTHRIEATGGSGRRAQPSGATAESVRRVTAKAHTKTTRDVRTRRDAWAVTLRDLAVAAPTPRPRLRVVASIPQKATVFKSALTPLGLTFEAVQVMPPEGVDGAKQPQQPTPYSVIFKSGDDLRQDQLVLQMLTLMDQLLLEQGLDLKLTTYRVLATGPGQGLVERVPGCLPLAQVLAENKNDIRRYLQLMHPAPEAIYGIDPDVLESFVKSCAGYCVAMYLLGVGDRHLDNLMLRSNGTLFHIDFGYIFGRDPKPFPPPMRLCKEMVEAMGGADSALYVKFRLLCSEAFNILRRPAASNTILNLLLLMADADVQDLKGGEQRVDEVLKLVTDRFRLDLTMEEASRYFQELINSSVSAIFPQIVERIHSLAQAFRA